MASGAARARASPLQASPRPGCRVCRLPPSERALINGGLSAGWSPRRLAERFNGLNRKDVKNHAKSCVSEGETEEKCR
jgi:hypothetical protein